MSENVAKSLDALIARVDEDRWLSSRYAPEHTRAQLIALYGLNYELARIRLAVSEPTLGAIRFQWWRDMLDAMDDPAQSGRHVVTQALAPMVAAGDVPAGALHTLIDRHQDAFEADDRALEPEALLATLAAQCLSPDWRDNGGTVAALAEAFATARRGEPAPPHPAIKVSPALRPALAHIALRTRYGPDRTPSALSKRWGVLRAIMAGRI